MSAIEQLVEQIGNLTLIEAVELRKTLEDKFGVKPNQSFVVENVPQKSAPQEVQTEFSVVMTGIDPSKKINVIKTLKSSLNISIMDAKSITESLPKPIKEGITKEEADKIVHELTEAGAIVGVK